MNVFGVTKPRTLKQILMKYRVPGVIVVVLAVALWSFTSLGNGSNANSSNRYSAGSAPGGNDSADLNGSYLESSSSLLYSSLNLDEAGLSTTAFELALKGWEKLKSENQLQNTRLLTIVDFSQPSTQKRLYVIDLEKRSLLYRTYVAHGRNSGREQAVNFSNRPRSNQSSPGFYRTESTYYGSNGYSLRLEGLEKGINDNAESRAIVMHGADYVNENMIQSLGYIGRSQGCPAIPPKMTRPIINTIKNGSCLFIYAPVTQYAQRSAILN